jgi:hypothetical protein
VRGGASDAPPDRAQRDESSLVRSLELSKLASHLLRHPGDVPPVVRAAWRLRRNSWWKKAPYLPLPGRRYWTFRLSTATGRADGTATVREVVEFARWSSLQESKQ